VKSSELNLTSPRFTTSPEKDIPPLSQHDKAKIIFEIITKLQKTSGTASKDELTLKVKERGITESDAEELLQTLKKNGEIYEPKANEFRRA